ncbi:MAG: YhjD/YihY/BrkB family envelope integrity protein [Mariprofundaceae bacterium]|nr:YhjD/YihY/BrkB family envelope integrity protein [Mariprofundaceae bacterium]
MLGLLMKWRAAALQLLWPEETESFPGWKLVLSRLLQISVAIVRDFLEGQLTLRAMSLVYTTLLSLVPLLALTFSVLKGFGVHNQLEPALLNALSALGEKGEEIARQIVSFVDNIKVGVLGSLGLGMLIYTVISLLTKIEKSFNYIWHIDQARAFGQRFSEYLSVILVGPLLIFSALGMTASLMSSTVVQEISTLPLLGLIVDSVGKLIPYSLVVAAFTFVYIFMPNTKVKIGPALIGGLIAGIAWESTGWIFGAFVVNSAKYTAIYSGFAILIMFMIWLFVSWLILLLGSRIAFYCQHPEHLGMRPGQLDLSARMTERLSLLVMFYIGRHYYRHQTGWQLDELARWLGVPVNVAEKILNKLHDRHLILYTSEKSPPYVPAQDMETMQLRHILDAVRTGDDGSGDIAWKLPEEPAVDGMLRNNDEAIIQAMGNQTLKEMVLVGARSRPEEPKAPASEN